MTHAETPLSLRLLGSFEIAGFKLPTRKGEALLGYLAVDAGTLRRRDTLMALLWGDRSDRQARHSLSQTLFSVRKALGDRGDALVVDGDCVMLSAADCAVDARSFETMAAGSDCAAWREAARLYRGELLQGLHLREPGFQEWVTGERGRFQEAAVGVFSRLVERHEADGEPDAAIRSALRLIALDPLRESAHRALMRLYAAQGETAAALRQYEHCAALLERELGVEPEAETRGLYTDIARRRRSARPTVAGPAAPASAPALPSPARARALAPLPDPLPPVPCGPAAVCPGPEIFGRDAELAKLDACLADALAGQRRLVFVTGEAGLGKTTLVDAFLARIAAGRPEIMIGRGQSIDLRGPGEPFMPLLDMLTMLGRLSPEVCFALIGQAPSWVPQLPGLGLTAASEVDGVSTRERMLRELLDALEAMAMAQPLLLVLEDLHWSDCSTLDVIDGFVRRRTTAPILLLATCRLSDPATALATVLELRSRGLAAVLPLQPLDSQAVHDCLVERYGAQVPAGLPALLTRRGGGNPLFMQNLLDWWIDRGHLVRSEAGLALTADPAMLERGLPETLSFLLDQQLERLEAAERAVLEAGAVSGAVFPAAAVAAALAQEGEAVERTADDLARRGALLRPAGETVWPDGTISQAFAFQHQLYRDGVYQRLPPAARQRLHAAVALRLEAAFSSADSRPAAEIAMHFVEARMIPRALDFLEEAAAQAFARGAVRDAVALLDRGLSLLGQVEATDRPLLELRLQAARGPALVATRGFLAPEAEAAFRRSWELAEALGDARRLSAALFGLAALKEFRGDYLETQELIRRQETDVKGPLDPSTVVACAELMACSTFHNASFDMAVRESDRTKSAYVAERDLLIIANVGENPLVSCECWGGRSLWFLGRVEEAMARLESALRNAERSGHSFARAVAHEQMARLRQHMGQPSQALAHATRAIAFGEEYGFPYRMAAGKVLRGWARAMLGDLAEGMAEIEAGLAGCRDLGAVIEYPYLLSLQAEAFQAAGRPAAGLALLEEARREACARQGFFYDAEILRLIARLRLPGDEPGAEEALQAACARARTQGALEPETRAAIDLARLWLRQGRAAEACRLLDGLDPPLERRPAGQAVGDAGELRLRARERLAEPGRPLPAPVPPMQQIRFCMTADATRIAWSETGQGRPLVKAGNWLTHLEFDWQSPIWQPLFSELSDSCRLVRYDPRGIGLSDREPAATTFERWVDDLEAVADAAGLDRFALLGISQGAAVSIAYAARYPERVSHLILLNGYTRGRLKRGVPDAEAYLQALVTLIRQGWGGDHPAHRQMFGALYLPEGNAEQVDWFVALEGISATPDAAVEVCEIAARIDVSGLLPAIAVPTLVLHGRRDVVAPFEEGRIMAAGILGARMVALDSCNHLLLPEEPAWRQSVDEIRRFLRD